MRLKRVAWSDQSLQTKMLALALAATVGGIALVCTILIWHQNHHFRQEMATSQNVLATILAEQSSAAVVFEDMDQLAVILSSLRQNEAVELACAYGVNPERLLTSLVVNHELNCPERISAQDDGFFEEFYQVTRPIRIDNDPQGSDAVGLLYLRASLAGVRQQTGQFILVASLGGIVSAFVLFLVTTRFLHRLIRPIIHLAGKVYEITSRGDFSLRARVENEDELGQLSRAFNTMLATIEAQNRLIRNNTEVLERTVAERTAELRFANHELEAFSYSVSHDLRAPLRAIDGFSAALVEDYGSLLDDTAKDYVSRVRKAAARMGEQISAMLSLARVTQRTLEPAQLDLTLVVREVMDGFDLQSVPPTELLIQPGMRCYGDPELIRIAMWNLLENAWKYSSKQSVRRIEVWTTEEDDSVIIHVRDNGAGFDMAYLDQLFVAFNRLHSPQDFEGNGIGLATVYRVANRHHGVISAEGEPGKGATFHLKLPLLRDGN